MFAATSFWPNVSKIRQGRAWQGAINRKVTPGAQNLFPHVGPEYVQVAQYTRCHYPRWTLHSERVFRASPFLPIHLR